MKSCLTLLFLASCLTAAAQKVDDEVSLDDLKMTVYPNGSHSVVTKNQLKI